MAHESDEWEDRRELTFENGRPVPADSEVRDDPERVAELLDKQDEDEPDDSEADDADDT